MYIHICIYLTKSYYSYNRVHFERMIIILNVNDCEIKNGTFNFTACDFNSPVTRSAFINRLERRCGVRESFGALSPVIKPIHRKMFLTVETAEFSINSPFFDAIASRRA